jgi:uncharacterized membrane protein YoaK (UPF0700 family)
MRPAPTPSKTHPVRERVGPAPGRRAERARRWQRRHLFFIGLSAAAGWLDTLAWLHLGRVFASFMSGNLLFLGIAAGQAKGDPLAHAAVALAAFMLGAAVGGTLTGGDPDPGRLRRALLLEAGLLLSFGALWVATGNPGDRTWLALGLLTLGATAMGLQATVALAWHVPNVATVAMTATLAKLGERAGRGQAGAPEKPPLSMMLGLIAAYLLSAIVVAIGSGHAVMAFGPLALVLASIAADKRWPPD